MSGQPVSAENPGASREHPLTSRKDRLAIWLIIPLFSSLALALWAVYGPSVFSEMAAGFMALCF